MIRCAFNAAMALALAACSSTESRGGDPVAEANAATPSSSKVATPMQTGGPQPARSVFDAMPDFNGIGPLRFGMTAEQMRKAWGQTLYGEAQVNDPQACYYLRPRKDNYDLLFMVEAGKFVRVDVKTQDKTAPGGGRVGVRVDELRELYARRITASPNFYDSAATDLRIAPARGAPALLLFEANKKGVVTSWRVGKPQQVNYVEGCE